MGHDAFIQDRYVKAAELVLVRCDLFYVLYLEREVMQPRLVLSKAAFALLPEGQNQLFSITQETTTPAAF